MELGTGFQHPKNVPRDLISSLLQLVLTPTVERIYFLSQMCGQMITGFVIKAEVWVVGFEDVSDRLERPLCISLFP